MFSAPAPMPAPKAGTLEEFYGDWNGFVAVMEATTGRKVISDGTLDRMPSSTQKTD